MVVVKPTYKSTAMHTTHTGKSRVVYEGPRGGKYIKLDGKFVPTPYPMPRRA